MRPSMPPTKRVRVGELALYARTASYLRPDQLAHAIYRKIVPRSRPHRALDRVRVRSGLRIDAQLAPSSSPGLSPQALTFVGYEKPVAGGIDWRSTEMPRLWRYHLHYCDYVNDPQISEDWKRRTIADWISQNTDRSTDAWDPYPVSLRIVNWILFFVRLSSPPDASWLSSLYEQALWLEANLERRLLANHYLKNAKALLFAGAFFCGRDADRWRAIGLRLFLEQAREQFLPDGGHYERSPMYHAICLEDVLQTLALLKGTPDIAGADAQHTLAETARRALEFLDGIVMPDGEIPLFNDSALGQAPAPAQLFALGSRLVGYEQRTRERSVTIGALESSGYYVVRDGSDMLIVDCGLPGPRYQPGHAHNDCLSYELALRGRRFIVDTGVLNYEAGPDRRYARSTAAHNTLTVDGCDQSETWAAFRMGRRANPISPSLYKAQDGTVHFAGAHDGYRRLGGSIVHRRRITYARGTWSFQDEIAGSGRHKAESRIHLAPGFVATDANSAVSVRDADGELFATIAPSPNVSVRVEDAPYFPHFGVKEQATAIVMSAEGTLPLTMRCEIVKEESG